MESVLDRRLVNEHDRDVILDQVNALARSALQCGAVVDQGDRRLAVGARQNVKEFRIDSHVGNI